MFRGGICQADLFIRNRNVARKANDALHVRSRGLLVMLSALGKMRRYYTRPASTGMRDRMAETTLAN